MLQRFPAGASVFTCPFPQKLQWLTVLSTYRGPGAVLRALLCTLTSSSQQLLLCPSPLEGHRGSERPWHLPSRWQSRI